MFRLPALLTLSLLLPSVAAAQEISRSVSGLGIVVETAGAYPGGLLVVRLRFPARVNGIVYGILDGRRCPFFPTERGLRALVPVPVTYRPGPATLGVEVRAAEGRKRVALTVDIRPKRYHGRATDIPLAKRALLELRSSIRDGRLLLLSLRTVTPQQHWREFQPPVTSDAEESFGSPQTYPVTTRVEGRTDSIFGEYHRGIDYPTPSGTVVLAPAAGTVLLSGPLTLTGDTVVLDHGQGVLSVFYHLGRSDVRAGAWLQAGQRLGLSGDSGIAASPHVHWGAYVHGVAVDPEVLDDLLD